MSKEIQCKCCKEYWWEMNIHKTSGLCPNCYDYVANLEAKLAESELEAIRWEEHFNNAKMDYECLQEQLAEKEKRIEIARNVKQARIDSLELDKKICEEHKQIVFNQLLEKCKKANQDKISFAVEQLEKVKALCKKKFNWWENSEWEDNIYDKTDVSNAYFDIEANIEEQIEQLKGGK